MLKFTFAVWMHQNKVLHEEEDKEAVMDMEQLDQLIGHVAMRMQEFESC